MDGGTIQALLTILNVVIAAFVSSLTALGVSYFRARGQNLATKHDFDELSKQLKANTKLVETIKSEVSQRDWAQREWTTLRRINLVALLEKMTDCQAYLDRHIHHSAEGKMLTERDPLGDLRAIATLFFPELKNEVSALSNAYQTQIEVDLSLFRDAGGLFQAEFLGAAEALKIAARQLMTRIMNVDEGGTR